MINKSAHKFTAISTEEYRIYNYTDGTTETIQAPLQLAVTENGHRVFDAQGESHYIFLNKVKSITWKAKDGLPNFVE